MMINVVQFMTTLVFVVAITSCVTSRNIEWRNTNSTDEMMSTKFPVISIDELNEDAVELLPEYNSSDRNNSIPVSISTTAVATVAWWAVILMICGCICCPRLIILCDLIGKTRAYERLKQQRAADVARRLKLTEQQHICEKFYHIEK